MGCSGTFNGTNVPRMMQYVDVSYNELSGTPDLTTLPAGMQLLFLGENQLSDIPDLAELKYCTGRDLAVIGNPLLCGSTVSDVRCWRLSLPDHCACGAQNVTCGAC